MVRSMTGFGRCYLEDEAYTQVWEVRSVNGRHLDFRWRLPQDVRPFEASFEKIARTYASRGRVEVSLTLSIAPTEQAIPEFNEALALAMLERVQGFAQQMGQDFEPDFNRLLYLSSLWQSPAEDMDDTLSGVLEKGLIIALQDWNESRATEGKALVEDLNTRFLLMDGWLEKV